MTQRTSQQLMPPSQSDSPTERGGSGRQWIRACPWWNEYQFNNCRIAGLHPHSCQYEGWSKLDRCVVMIREKIITCAFPSLTLTIRDACYFLPSLVCCYPWTGVWASPPIPYPLTFFKYIKSCIKWLTRKWLDLQVHSFADTTAWHSSFLLP